MSEEEEKKEEVNINEEKQISSESTEQITVPETSEPVKVADATDVPASAEAEEDEVDELTGIEEASEQEIFQKVTKKETRKKRKKRSERGQDKGKEASEWIEKVVQIRRVTKVVKGGKKLSFRAVVVVGNAKGQVGVGVGKALEVISAIQKAVVDAKKNLIPIPLINSTIPHQILGRAGAAKVLLKPAREGTGIKAGGAARTVLELGGVGDILSKSLGSRSPLNVARATLNGLTKLRQFGGVAQLRGMTLKEMIAAN